MGAAQLEEESEGPSTDDGSDGGGSQQGDAPPVSEELIYALLSGDLHLPLTDQVPLPDMVRSCGSGNGSRVRKDFMHTQV